MVSRNYTEHYYILHDFGIIISLIAGFIFAGLGENIHYIVTTIMLMILSMCSAALPYARYVVWPVVFGLICYMLAVDPHALYEILIGDYGNDLPLTPWLGLIYIVAALIVIPGVVYAGHITDREEYVYGAAAASFLSGLFSR